MLTEEQETKNKESVERGRLQVPSANKTLHISVKESVKLGYSARRQ